jgi:hypothetical protein
MVTGRNDSGLLTIVSTIFDASWLLGCLLRVEGGQDVRQSALNVSAAPMIPKQYPPLTDNAVTRQRGHASWFFAIIHCTVQYRDDQLDSSVDMEYLIEYACNTKKGDVTPPLFGSRTAGAETRADGTDGIFA